MKKSIQLRVSGIALHLKWSVENVVNLKKNTNIIVVAANEDTTKLKAQEKGFIYVVSSIKNNNAAKEILSKDSIVKFEGDAGIFKMGFVLLKRAIHKI